MTGAGKEKRISAFRSAMTKKYKNCWTIFLFCEKIKTSMV